MANQKISRPLLLFAATLSLFLLPSSAQLRQNFYANICPNVESIVRDAVTQKFRQTFTTAPATLRLFFHDCAVNVSFLSPSLSLSPPQGCDASVIIASTPGNTAEKDNPDNLSLAGDGFDTVIKAKAAVDAVPQCRNKVSCADILAMAARDVVALAGGPSYAVELGRLDGLSSTAASVDGKLPLPSFSLDQLTASFAAMGLSQTDVIALSGAHTIGFSHCNRFAGRIYDFRGRAGSVDPTLNSSYAAQLQAECPRNVDPSIAIQMDPVTPHTFDNQYYRNLQARQGLFTSDQALQEDARSRPLVDAWARNPALFNRAFVTSMTRLGRVGVKTRPAQGNIRRDCSVLN
ncbi:Peroxidase 51 [Apostasia shenzhenica]|uniref:Peroxidase n=1 Tax=Apostasia shenzhenica TaxID=1088818 RepID=A0A2I0ADM5_9ASPA|nr:Peroxidase 51 [Apostasia shenzhenica]